MKLPIRRNKAKAGKESVPGPVEPSTFQFEDVFLPQRVILTSPGDPPFAENLPNGFLLTPHFGQNLDLHLDVTGLLYQPCAPPRDVLWTAPQVIIDSGMNVSVFMNDQDDWLILSGVMDIDKQSGTGTWQSSLGPFMGSWSSVLEYPTKPINLDYFWWSLLIAPANPETNPVKTVMLEFEVEGDGFFQRRSLPDGWIVTKFTLNDEGVLIQLISPDSLQYCLQGGSFSGEIGSMVCNGRWLASNVISDCPKNPHAPTDGGTWTGTGGGAGLFGHP